MDNTTGYLQARLKYFAEKMESVSIEASDIYAAYFASGANVSVDALASSTTAATVSTRLTKGEYQNGITLIGQINNFFGNIAVSQAGYLTTVESVLYGSAASPAFVSDAVEDIGARIKLLFSTVLLQFNDAKNILSIYNNSELSVLASGLTAYRVIYGADMTNSQMSLGVTLVEQFKKLINNEDVAQGAYSNNVAIWKLIQ